MRIALVSNDFEFRIKDGISRYSYELYNYLKKNNEIYLYTFKEVASNFLSNVSLGIERIFGTKIDNSVDIVHVLYPNAIFPITKKPVVVTWHDADVFTRYKASPFSPRFYHWLGVVLPALRNTKRSNGIVYVSEETKYEVDKYIRKYSNKDYAIVPNGIDQAFIDAKVKRGVERRDFVFVGSVHFAHKNVHFLIRSFVEASPKDNDLYIFTPTEESKIPKEFFNYKNVHIIIKAQTEEIIDKLSKSIALLHFSKLEGFGYPILEAMALGTPVVVLKDANIPKITTKYAIKIDEADATKTIIKLAQEKPELSDEAIKYAKSFSWERSARETEAFYKKILNQK